MKVLRWCLLMIATLLSSGIAFSASSVDLSYVGRFSIGCGHFELPSSLNRSIALNMYQFGGAVRYKNVYVAINLSDTLSGNTETDQDNFAVSGYSDASRYDRDIVIGFYPEFGSFKGQNWSFFLGYKTGRTDIDNVDISFSNLSDSTFYEHRGMFIGAHYSFQFETAGRIALGLAYADLEFENTINNNVDRLRFSDGSSTGFSYSVSWKIPISGKLSFNSSIKVNDYELSPNSSGNATNDGILNTLDHSDRYTILSLGVSRYF